MVFYFSNNFKSGTKIILNKAPYIIEYSEFIKPGKGQSFVRTKLRCLLNGQLIEKTFKFTDNLEIANVIDIEVVYLYTDNSFWYFMNTNSYEHIIVEKSVILNNIKWIFKEEKYKITLWDNKPILIIPPKFIILEVIETIIEYKGDNINSYSKPAKLSNNMIIKVPNFIKIGDIIKINTSLNEYVSRIK